jgi:MFS family permease
MRSLPELRPLSRTVWQLGLFRLLAGFGIGGEWTLAGTYVAEAWPEHRRKMGTGYLQTGYCAGLFWLRRSTTRSQPAMAGGPCSGAA